MGAAQARELGDELRQFREGLGIHGNALAERLGWSPSKVSRIENGFSRPTEIDVIRYAAHCGVSASSIDALLEMSRDPGTPGYWISKRMSTLVLHETTATSSASYDPLVVPGLLQTQEYATALMSAAGLEPLLVRYWAEARMERQHVLHSRRFEFFIHEQALRLPVGGNRLMNEQLLRLVLVADQSRVAIRVVPTRLGARSVFGGEFVQFRFAEHRPLVFVEPVGLYLEDPDQVAAFQDMLTGLSEVALDRRESREMLAALASEFDQPEDSPDAHDNVAEEQLQQRA